MNAKASIAFLKEAATYFSKQPTDGEDSKHWANVLNSENCTHAAEVIASQASRMAELEKALNNVIEAAERALGDHAAPHDCFATGPMTGNPIADLVACPGCVQVNEIAAARSVLSTQAAE